MFDIKLNSNPITFFSVKHFEFKFKIKMLMNELEKMETKKKTLNETLELEKNILVQNAIKNYEQVKIDAKIHYENEIMRINDFIERYCTPYKDYCLLSSNTEKAILLVGAEKRYEKTLENCRITHEKTLEEYDAHYIKTLEKEMHLCNIKIEAINVKKNKDYGENYYNDEYLPAKALVKTYIITTYKLRETYIKHKNQIMNLIIKGLSHCNERIGYILSTKDNKDVQKIRHHAHELYQLFMDELF